MIESNVSEPNDNLLKDGFAIHTKDISSCSEQSVCQKLPVTIVYLLFHHTYFQRTGVRPRSFNQLRTEYGLPQLSQVSSPYFAGRNATGLR
jgi:hypothetical protein